MYKKLIFSAFLLNMLCITNTSLGMFNENEIFVQLENGDKFKIMTYNQKNNITKYYWNTGELGVQVSRLVKTHADQPCTMNLQITKDAKVLQVTTKNKFADDRVYNIELPNTININLMKIIQSTIESNDDQLIIVYEPKNVHYPINFVQARLLQ